MKYILIIIFTFFIIYVPSHKLETCNIDTASNAISPILFYEQTIDGSGQNVLITRFLHNKVGIFTSQIAKCYLEYFNPVNVFLSTGIYGLMFLLYFAYKVFSQRLVLLGAVLLFPPILLILINLPYLTSIYYKLVSILGVVIYFKKT